MADRGAPTINLTPEQIRDIADGKLLLMDVLGINPGEMLQHLDNAMNLVSISKLDDATRILKGLAALDVKNPAFASALGSIDLVRKNYASAAEHARQAIALDPQFINAYYVLAEALLQEKRPADGIKALEKAFSLRPNDESRDGRRARSIYLGLTGKQPPTPKPGAQPLAPAGAPPQPAGAPPRPAGAVPGAAPRPVAAPMATRAGSLHGGAFGGRAQAPAMVTRAGGPPMRA